MPNNFFDTSALGKHYHPEVGTAKVDAALSEPGAHHFISRLGVVEMLSVFAGKVRAGVIAAADFDALRRRFLTDVTHRLFQVVRMTGLPVPGGGAPGAPARGDPEASHPGRDAAGGGPEPPWPRAD
jgi:hypothetical protein